MQVYVDLPEETDVEEWPHRNAAGVVPEPVPYGLHKLADHGVHPRYRPPLRHPSAVWVAQKVRSRLGGADVVAAALAAGRRERRQADAVLTWDERNGVPAALIPGGPPVVSGAMWLTEPEQFPPALRRLTRIALPRMAALFHLFPTTGVVERVWGLRPGTVHRITMGIDEEFYAPRPRPEGMTPLVVGVGDDRRRDHKQLVRVVDQVAKRGLPVRLEIATTLEVDVPEHLGMVHRRRMDGDIRGLYERATVVAIAMYPAPGGGGLSATLEAMSSGRPVVVTANEGMSEYVEHERTGLLVPPGDEAAFTEAVASLVADPAGADEMGREARRVVEKRFTSAHTMAELAAVLRSVG